MSSAVSEPSLQPDESRFVMFPVKHNDVWDLQKKTIDYFWKAGDIDQKFVPLNRFKILWRTHILKCTDY